ncbi:hypothetical protein TNCV_641461 [Trichonephila clavipes]|nr:hypothetical protein TNCV_641461 [Trichonephila clavipes]
MVFTKENKHPFGGGLLVDDASSDLALPSSIFQCIGFIGQRHGHHRGRKDAIQQGLPKEAVVSLNASVTVPTWMDDHHGWTITMDERLNLECGNSLKTIIDMKSKSFKLYYVTVPTLMDDPRHHG